MELSDWIVGAFRPANRPHRFASFVLARQASRDLGAEITTAQFETAMPFQNSSNQTALEDTP